MIGLRRCSPTMSKSDFGCSVNTSVKRVEETPLSLTRLRCCRRGRSRFESRDKCSILTLLREFKPCIVVPLLQVLLPMAVERVDDALRVGLSRVDDVARLLLRLVGRGGEALRYGLSEVALPALEGVRLLAVGQLVLIAHLEDCLLCLAAAVLKSVCHGCVARLHGVDNTLGAETNSTTDLLNG